MTIYHTTSLQSLLIGLSTIVALSLAARTRADDKPAKLTIDQPEPHVYTDADGEKMPYLLLKPKDYDPNKRYPLVLFYHGAGERGDDNHSQWRNGVEVFQKPENREKFPCFVVAPQCPRDKQWVN